MLKISFFKSVILFSLNFGETAAATTMVKVIDPPKAMTDKKKKVFVVHGRDERLRAGLFTLLRALNLEPMEWNTLTSLTAEGSPYIGDVL